MRPAHETAIPPDTAVFYAEQVALCRERLREAEALLQRAHNALRWSVDPSDAFPALRADVERFLARR